MNNEKQITPTIREHAKKFHDLWTKGYSVAEAADMMGMNKFTIYKQLHLYAEVNGVASRLVYIRDYSARTINPKDVTIYTGSGDSVNDENIVDVYEKSSELHFTEVLSVLQEIIEQSEITVESVDSFLNTHIRTFIVAKDIKEEKV